MKKSKEVKVLEIAWIIIIIIVAYLPMFYRIHKRLDHLEKEVKKFNSGQTDYRKGPKA